MLTTNAGAYAQEATLVGNLRTGIEPGKKEPLSDVSVQVKGAVTELLPTVRAILLKNQGKTTIHTGILCWVS